MLHSPDLEYLLIQAEKFKRHIIFIEFISSISFKILETQENNLYVGQDHS